MNAVMELMRQGGPVMLPLGVLSIVLYERCVHLMLQLRRLRHRLLADPSARPQNLRRLRCLQDDLQETFFRQRSTIGVLVAAAPLLGLLGTVMGMVDTFESISTRTGRASIDGLAGGISMALITTETGLGIAIPAVLIVYYAQRQWQKTVQHLATLEGEFLEANR
jgi:biopolymer transport protein ExbB